MASLGRFDMSNGYKVRVYESREENGALSLGTVVQPLDPSFTLSADSADEATNWIRTNVLRSRLPSSRIYQICPMIGNPEPIRSVAAGLDGSFSRVFLDPASELSGELRRVRDLESLSALRFKRRRRSRRPKLFAGRTGASFFCAFWICSLGFLT